MIFQFDCYPQIVIDNIGGCGFTSDLFTLLCALVAEKSHLRYLLSEQMTSNRDQLVLEALVDIELQDISPKEVNDESL